MKTAKAIFSALGLVVIASGPAMAQNETVAVFTKNQTNPFFETVRVGTNTAAKALGVKVIQYIPIKPDSIPEQLSQVEDAIIKKPSAVLFTPVDYKALVPAIDKMVNANIPVIGMTDRPAGGGILSFVGVDDHRLGLETSINLFKAMGGKGNVIALEGVKGTLTSADRMRGFNDAVKQFPGIKVLASQPANYQRLQALQVMENLMQTHPQVDAVFAANDAMATGVVEALAAANRKALVVGINGSKEAVDLIKAGKMHASGSSDPFMQGCLGLITTIRALRKMPISKELMVPVVIIDTNNYRDHDVPLESRSCPKLEEVAAK